MNIARWILGLLILKIQPIGLPNPPSSTGICTLLCHDHVFLFLSNILSLKFFGGIVLPITIVDDGTLTQWDMSLLSNKLKNCVIISRNDADTRIPTLLTKHPFSLKYWRETDRTLFAHHRKLFEPFLLSDYKKYIILDADILFFHPPKKINSWLNSGTNTTLFMTYPLSYIDKHNIISTHTIKAIGQLYNLPMNAYFNSGIVCTYRNTYNLAMIEKGLKMIYALSLETQWFGEQLTLSAVFSNNRKTATPLPSDRYVVLTDSKRHDDSSTICIHYHSHYKDKMVYQSINLAMKIILKSYIYEK